MEQYRIDATPISERSFVWDLSINLLEQHNMVQSNPTLKRFAWHAAYVQHWHAFIHVLDALRVEPTMEDADRAWQFIGNKYANTPDMLLDMRKPIHVAIGNLCIKADDAREAALRGQHKRFSPAPDFIFQLRQQRELRRTRRAARSTRDSRPMISVGHQRTHAQSIESTPRPSVARESDVTMPTNLQQISETQHSCEPTTDMSGTFDLLEPFGDSHVGNLNEDSGFNIEYDQNLEADAIHTIDWDQWDIWLAHSHIMQPSSS